MSRKKKAPTTPATSLQALKIGSRVRCTDDRVEGRIIWANAASVKIKWDDGEQVTWKRDSLVGRPIEILDAVAEDDQPAAPPAPATSEQPATSEVPQAEPEATLATTGSLATEAAAPVPEPTAERAASGTSGQQVQTAAKPKRQRKAPAEPKEKKTSAIDAAVKLLEEAASR
jgi:hypothetical protein